MLAWAGDQARPPGDLDWVVPNGLWTPIDEEHPYPYIDELETVQQWPEVADGAARFEFWREEEFGTGGSHPRTPPEGLNWIPDLDAYEPDNLRWHVADLVRDSPKTAEGILLDPDGISYSDDWAESYADGGGGTRLLIPWQAQGLEPDRLRLDFAYDETLADTPVWAAVPRGDGGTPTAVRTASRESSLAWKLLWLNADSATDTGSQGKDLYDAVLLAESDQTRLTPSLLRKVLRRSPSSGVAEFCLDAIRVSDEEWTRFQQSHPLALGPARQWIDRLGRALGSSAPDR